MVVCNHPSWWDPILCALLSPRWPHRADYCPIDAQALRAYAQRIHFFEDFQAQLFNAGQFGTTLGLGFQLVPWTPSLEKQLGQHVSGVARSDGGIDWGFGRKRGLGL